MTDRPRGPHRLLVYAYGPDALERRKPHRPAHLALVEEYFADGRLIAAGAVGDPPTGGLLAFREDVDVQAFVAADPYVSSGLVTSHRIERWTLV
jgi:uncharacterized protein YciI